jgi:hypothetical protein
VILTKLAYWSDKVKDDVMGGYVGCMEEKRNAYKILVGKDEKRDRKEELVVNRRTVLKQRLKKYNGRKWSGFLWLKVETSGQRLYTQ